MHKTFRRGWRDTRRPAAAIRLRNVGTEESTVRTEMFFLYLEPPLRAPLCRVRDYTRREGSVFIFEGF